MQLGHYVNFMYQQQQENITKQLIPSGYSQVLSTLRQPSNCRARDHHMTQPAK